MTQLSDWTVTMSYPEQWIEPNLDLPDDQRRQGLLEAADQVVGNGAEVIDAAAEDLAARMAAVADGVAAHAINNDGLFVAVGFERVDSELAALEVGGYLVNGPADGNLEALAGELARPDRAEQASQYEVELVELPAGPAVRVHSIGPDGPPNEAGGVKYIERVSYFIAMHGHEELFLLSCSTPSIAVGEAASIVFDAIAQTVEFEPAEQA